MSGSGTDLKRTCQPAARRGASPPTVAHPAAAARVHTLRPMPEAAHREAPPARACHVCGARQDECQEICVECGVAVPRARTAATWVRSGARPVALAGFAVLVVTSAAYGITANAGREESAVKVAATSAQPATAPHAATAPASPPAAAPTTPAPAAPTPAKPAPAADPKPIAPTPSPVK